MALYILAPLLDCNNNIYSPLLLSDYYYIIYTQMCARVYFMNTRIDNLIESAKLSRRNEVNLILQTGYGE